MSIHLATLPGTTVTVPLPQVRGPIAQSATSHLFSTMQHATVPVDLAALGYLEEEYFLSGTAAVYGWQGSEVVALADRVGWTTRILVRRPITSASRTAWVSILNASQGYDIEDDWRRAWDYIISRGDTYVGITSKPITADALQNFDPERYADLTWGGRLPGIEAHPGWNPFQVIGGSEEGLAWDIIAQTAAWVRSGGSFGAPEHVFLMGQSQSAIYTNTYLSFFHHLLLLADGSHPFDGYLPGVGSVFCREISQPRAEGDPDGGLVILDVEPVELDVPVIAITSDGDTHLFDTAGSAFRRGDGELRRHWHVAAAPHSDARSRVIPDNAEILRAKRLPRVVDDAFLAVLSVFPLEPVITAAMAAIVTWVETGRRAAPSRWFDADGDALQSDENGVRTGGVRLGLLEEPLARFSGASPENAVYGAMELLGRDEILARYPDVDSYIAACDLVDDRLEAEGYLEPHGRGLLHRIEHELWERAVDGAAPLRVTPQRPGTDQPNS